MTTSDQTDVLQVEDLEQNIWRVGIHRPTRKNALNTALVVHLADTLDALVEQDARVVIIYGCEGNFAAGADIDEIATLSPQQALLDARVAAWQRIRRCPIPLIAAVEGYCLGGGMELLLSCDFAVADASAQFGLPEVKLGLIPGAGGTQILPRLLGSHVAARMIYTGEIFPVEKMVSWGLVTDVCRDSEDTMQLAYTIAKKIAHNAPFAIRQAKQSLRNSMEMGLESAMSFERQSFSLLASTQDKTEGIAAFKEKRHAKFLGK